MRNEIFRKALHILLGIFVVALLQLGYLNIPVLSVMLLGALVLFLLARFRIPWLMRLLEIVDKGEKVYGRGPLTYMIGIILVYIFFSQQPSILSAAIIILALGDGMAGIIGRYTGKITLPFNRQKTLEGLLAGFFFSFLGAFIFVPVLPALIVSAISSFMEAIPLKTKDFRLDDNLYIPLLAAFLLSIM